MKFCDITPVKVKNMRVCMRARANGHTSAPPPLASLILVEHRLARASWLSVISRVLLLFHRGLH